MGERTYYLDHAAATPCDERVIAAMAPFWAETFYNPSAGYEGGRMARQALENARVTCSRILGAKPYEIVFTAGATESVHIALGGVLAGGGHAVVSAVEHAAVQAAVASYAFTVAHVDGRGYVTPEAVAAAVNDETVVVSVALADNEFGTVQPVAEIARRLERIRNDRRTRGVVTPLYLHSDGSQAAISLDMKVSRLGVDMLTLNAAKCYGPKQVGLLWLGSQVRLRPFLSGGGQERGLRSGTENVAGAAGIATAFELVQGARHSENERLAVMRTELIGRLSAAVPDMVVDGHPKKHLPGHIHIHLAGLDAERVVFRLSDEGIYCATGAACAANKQTRSLSLEAVGMSPAEADGSLRLTLGHLNKLEDIPYVAGRIAEAIAKERGL